MKISYAITVCNELFEIQRLMDVLLKHKKSEDEIVVLFDAKNGSLAVEDYLRSHSSNSEFRWMADCFEGHFANWKNKLASICDGDYIFQIDADEVLSQYLMDFTHFVLETNPELDLVYVPRVNTVEGITQEHIQKWGWRVNENGWINWPDFQSRIYKNNGKIRWVNKVHEVLTGNETYAQFPMVEEYALRHPKTILKQEKQNNYYDTL